MPETWDGSLPGGFAWVGALLWLGAGCLAWRRPRFWYFPLGLGMGLLTLWGLSREARRDRVEIPRGLVRVEGTIAAPWMTRDRHRLGRLRLASPQEHAGLDVEVRLPAEGLPAPAPGTPVSVLGELLPVTPGPGFLGERLLWRARALNRTRRMVLRSAAQFEIQGPPSPGLLLVTRIAFQGRLERLQLSPLARDVWGALTLGISPVNPDHHTLFTESGTLHVLVVSGLQVTLLMGLAEAAARRLLRRGSGFAAVALGLAYAALVGFSAPVWRGWLMGAAWALSRSQGWALPPALSLHGALAIWLALHPSAGADPGFLLSWAALLGVIWVAEPLAGLASPLLGAHALPLARVAAPWLTTLPLLVLFHGGIPIWGIPANLVLLPLVAFLTPACLALTAIPLPVGVNSVGWLLDQLGTQLLPRFTGIRPMAAEWTWPYLILLLGWLWLAHRHATLRRTRAWVVSLSLASAVLVGFRGIGSSPRTLVVEAIDVGQGDAILIRAPGSEALLFDTGGSPWAARRIARVLSRRGVREPLQVVLSHPHGDHAGGWKTLARLWPLSSTRRPESADPLPLWAPFSDLPLYGDTLPLRRGDGWSTGTLTCQVHWPPKPLSVPNLNAHSAVVRVEWQDREIWCMGDAEALQELDLLDLGDPGRSPGHRLLKAGHHGAGAASSALWLEALKPDLAILTAGRDNVFGFPHPQTRQRLEAVGCAWHDVGRLGGVQIWAIPGGWGVRSMGQEVPGQKEQGHPHPRQGKPLDPGLLSKEGEEL